MATAAQLLALQRVDSVTYAAYNSRPADREAAIDAAVTWFAAANLNATVRARAVSLLAAHELLADVDPDGRNTAGAVTSNGTRATAASDKLPAGYPPDWYETRHGRKLISALSSSASVSIPMMS